MYLEALNSITLKAFVMALTKATPLPEPLQNRVREAIKNEQWEHLHGIAKSHPPLFALYKEFRLELQVDGKRSGD